MSLSVTCSCVLTDPAPLLSDDGALRDKISAGINSVVFVCRPRRQVRPRLIVTERSAVVWCGRRLPSVNSRWKPDTGRDSRCSCGLLEYIFLPHNEAIRCETDMDTHTHTQKKFLMMPLCAELISATVIPAASTHHRLLPPLSSSAGAKTCESNQQQKKSKRLF